MFTTAEAILCSHYAEKSALKRVCLNLTQPVSRKHNSMLVVAAAYARNAPHTARRIYHACA